MDEMNGALEGSSEHGGFVMHPRVFVGQLVHEEGASEFAVGSSRNEIERRLRKQVLQGTSQDFEVRNAAIVHEREEPKAIRMGVELVDWRAGGGCTRMAKDHVTHSVRCDARQVLIMLCRRD